MKQTHAWLLWLPLSAVSSLALAVGLGPASVNSPLDAPLNATVPVLDASQYALDDLRVAVADEAAFTALGLEWTPLVSSLRAQLREKDDGHQVVLSSSQAVEEPWLDVLLTISSPEGETSQAFTLLFDPVDMLNASSASPSVSPVARAVESRSHAQPAATPMPQNAPRDSAPAVANTVYVASGDSLWGVAERVKPASASVQQMMVALVDANPEVFSSGNIDSMRAGQTLAMPRREKILARSPVEAAQRLQAVRRANERTDASTVRQSPAESARGEPANSSDSIETAATQEAQGQADAEQAAVEIPGQDGSRENALAGLTLNDVVEQLRESQAMLQLVLEEREQLRSELIELRQEVAALTEALNASQREAQAVAALAVTAPEASGEPALGASNAPRSVADSRGFVGRLSDYQWPIASAALALLLAGLVWSRKRRERQWEVAPLSTAPSTVTPPAPSAGRADPPIVEPHSQEPLSAESRKPEPSATEPHATEPSGAEALAASGLSGSGPSGYEPSATKPSLPTSTFDEAPEGAPGTVDEAPEEIAFEESSPASSVDDDEVLNAAFLDTPQPVDEYPVELVDAANKEPDEALEAASPSHAASQEDQRSQPIDYYVDYRPASLSQSEKDGRQGAFEDKSTDGAKVTSKESSHPVRHTPRVPEEEWEIEEVAFEPRRRDNG